MNEFSKAMAPVSLMMDSLISLSIGSSIYRSPPVSNVLAIGEMTNMFHLYNHARDRETAISSEMPSPLASQSPTSLSQSEAAGDHQNAVEILDGNLNIPVILSPEKNTGSVVQV